MCRWFVYISEHEECLLEDVLVTPKHSISKQVHEHYLPKLLSHSASQVTTEEEVTVRNRLFNIDGLGVAWYTTAKSDFSPCQGPRPAVYKSAQPPINDLNFRSICANTATKVCFAHIRAATATPVTHVNCHPFVFGRHTFMHNGYVSQFLEIKRDLCQLLDASAYANVQGSTDSEHVAALYMTYLRNEIGDATWEVESNISAMRAAMHHTFKAIITLQKDRLGSAAQPNDLNIVVTDGKHLVAYRFRNHETEQPPSLYYSTVAGVTLNRKYPRAPDGSSNPDGKKSPSEHQSHVIIASEPTTYDDEEWSLIEKNHCVIVEASGNVIIERVNYTA